MSPKKKIDPLLVPLREVVRQEKRLYTPGGFYVDSTLIQSCTRTTPRRKFQCVLARCFCWTDVHKHKLRVFNFHDLRLHMRKLLSQRLTKLQPLRRASPQYCSRPLSNFPQNDREQFHTVHDDNSILHEKPRRVTHRVSETVHVRRNLPIVFGMRSLLRISGTSCWEESPNITG